MTTGRRASPESGAGSDSNHVDGDTTAAEASLKQRLNRKRTKTGCLTCRKRRIKCGEERPMCKNCVKSRRHCEGYIQRVVFKPPTFDYRPQAGLPNGVDQHIPHNVIYHHAAFADQIAFSPIHPQPFAVEEGMEGHFVMPSQSGGFPSQMQLHTHNISPITPGSYIGSAHSSSPVILNDQFTAYQHPSWGAGGAPFQPLASVDPTLPNTNNKWHDTGQVDVRQAVHVRSSPSTHSDARSLDFQQMIDAGPAQLLLDAAVEQQDDDYYDVSDDEDGSKALADRSAEHSLMKIIQNVQHLQLSYDTFISHGLVDRYRPERVASPLRNPATARVFLHFITSTGPGLSPFERNTGPSFAGHEPLGKRGLWTHIMPMLALHNQGLLHAMLALASLHIARLQGGSITPAMQHYAWSLKRIHHAVSQHKTRLHLTTIAASLLLGFFEIMTAEHAKWNTHLAGAKQLIMETDYKGMTKTFMALKRMRRAQGQQYHSELDEVLDIDEDIVGRMLGQQVRYEEPVEDLRAHTLDLSKYEMLKDMWWWYLKQDCYRSVISSDPPLMDYHHFTDCPPRGPIGRIDAVYGSFDHLILILGRIAHFAARDRARKLEVMQQQGGWRPHPNSRMAKSRPPPSAGSRTPQTPVGPTFYGMAPTSGLTQMPTSYEPLSGKTSPKAQQETWTMDDALQEYDSIQQALASWKNHLGPDFEPVPDDQTPYMTAFGPALFYRSYDIACMMAIYNMTVIIAIRSHPYYHPAAHVAAAMAAPETAELAQEVGRIAAVITPGPPNVPLRPQLGAALTESCISSFFAAIQYTDAEQRKETVVRIWNISQRTGWETAAVIANGCETAWMRAYENGRGPPYTRIVRSSVSEDARMNGSWETPTTPLDVNDQVDRRFITRKPLARLHWAAGILAGENDV